MGKKINEGDFVWNWFDCNLDLHARTIYMGSVSNSGNESGVDAFMAEKFIKGIHLLENSSAEEITIIMNNPGGDWYHGMGIYDSIFNCKCICTIKVYGYAMSMGSIILQAADNRILMPNSRFMIHYGTSFFDGPSKSFDKWAQEERLVNYTMENIYLRKMMEKIEKDGITKFSKNISSIVNRQQLNELPKPELIKYTFSRNKVKLMDELRVILKTLLNFDSILTAEETISIGLADNIHNQT